MSLKFKISILHIIVSFVTIFFIYMIYDSYVTSQKKDIENQLMRLLKLNEDHMKNSLANIEQLLFSKKDLSQKMHLQTHNSLKQNMNIPLKDLSEKLKEEYSLKEQNLNIEVFLIDDNYKVIDSTHKKNIGLDLNLMDKSKASLDSLKNIDQYNYSKDVSVDFLDYEIKSFSYSRLSSNTYLGLGLIYEDSVNEKKSFNEMREMANTHMDLFCVMKDGNNNQYYETLVEHKTSFSSNEEYLQSKEKFPIRKVSDNLIIKTARTWKMQNIQNDNILSIYIPLVKEKNPMMNIPGDIILQIDLDISQQKEFVDTILHKLILFILIHFLMVIIIFYFTNRYQKIEKKLNAEILKNQELVEYNKHFISNLVHQIRTPLAVIMINISLLEVMIQKKIKKYTSQINASINLLSNSYENLSYCVSYKNLSYPKRKIHLASFIKNRIEFFDPIAFANKKNIIAKIDNEISCTMNDIELERLLDNNISNAIHFSKIEGTIVISLTKEDEKVKLLFRIKNSKYIDLDAMNNEDINYRKDLSSLGLGVYLVKKIAEKNHLGFSFYKKENEVYFEYTLN